MTQLDLFKEQRKSPQSTAVLVPFPLMHRRKLIAATVALLTSRKTAEGQQAAWTKTINKLATELRRYGADQPEVDSQLQAFYSVVAAELAQSNHQQPGGAA